jgi:hypothetical protein
MTWKTFLVLFGIYLALFGLMWWVFSTQFKHEGIADTPEDIPGWHYAVDTMTLRGRLADPADKFLKDPTFFKIWEDLSSLAIFILFGFGVAFSISTVDAVWAIRAFRYEPPEERRRLRTFEEWVKDKHPETYYSLYPHKEGPAKSGWLVRLWLLIKRWLLNVKDDNGGESHQK